MSTCSKAWPQTWEDYSHLVYHYLYREMIYFYNLAYIYGELSLTITEALIIHSVISTSDQQTQYSLIHNCLHSVFAHSQLNPGQ